LLFYIFQSHGNEKKEKKMKKGGQGVKRGDAVSCPQAPVEDITAKILRSSSGTG
jgi:hypothetical protein